jgi:LysM domain-containing protein
MSSLAVAPATRSTRTGFGRPDRAPERVARAGGSRTGLRLTRRGRLVVFLTFLAAALAVGVFALSGAATGSGERGQPVPVTMVQVESGDTLWSIATRVAPGEDPRDLIDEIEELNALNGSLPVGERIAVPVAE